MLAELIKMISRFKLSIRNLYRTCSNLIAFYIVLLCLLLICGDIEPNPGPERTHEYSEKTLSIFHCNIRSLRNKLNYIADIIEDYDVVFFTETHLDSNITDYDISIMGFETPVRKDRNSHGGGIIMYFKNYVHIIRRQDLEHDEIEITDSIPVLDKDTIPIDRGISDHDGTYVTIDCGFSKSRTYIRSIWDYKRGDYDLMKQKVLNTNWENLIKAVGPDIVSNRMLLAVTLRNPSHISRPFDTTKPGGAVWTSPKPIGSAKERSKYFSFDRPKTSDRTRLSSAVSSHQAQYLKKILQEKEKELQMMQRLLSKSTEENSKLSKELEGYQGKNYDEIYVENLKLKESISRVSKENVILRGQLQQDRNPAVQRMLEKEKLLKKQHTL
ncbi:unnamed protein product [Mytilus edulis]|uniref:Endonuclease/exonuclease/phosphatase domain-containing protein n=1 Tax=Mytilus edulis TaxID=6550 RepID=A0A8S3TIF0_MYTED|nr:unnamed protein product [Mytilus edulis]